MGEIAEMMEDGVLCSGCGVFMDNLPIGKDGMFIPPWSPQFCHGCNPSPKKRRPGQNQAPAGLKAKGSRS